MWLALDHLDPSSGAGPRARRAGLSGTVVVVTGAGWPAGRAVVERLAAKGAFVVAVDTEESRIGPLVDSVRSAGGRCAGRAVDLVDERATTAWASSLVDQCEHVDGLVHLVGGLDGMSAIDADSSDWDWMQALVVRSLQNVSLALREQLQASPRGRLGLVSTLEAGRPTASNAYYAAALAAAEAWLLSTADYLRGTPAAATIIRLRGLLAPALAPMTGTSARRDFVDVATLARCVESLWDRAADELNGTRIDLTEPAP